MHSSTLYKLVLVFILNSFLYGCTKKVGLLPCDPSYTKDIRPILNLKCAISGCHVSGAPMGDYTTYADFKARADNGKIKFWVFDIKGMPLGSTLSEEQLQEIKCWLDNGAKNN